MPCEKISACFKMFVECIIHFVKLEETPPPPFQSTPLNPKASPKAKKPKQLVLRVSGSLTI